jgi:hypothetical protein
LCRCILPLSWLFAICSCGNCSATSYAICATSLFSVLLAWDRHRFRALFFGGLNSEQLSFWKRALHCFRSAHTEFSLISLLCRRKNLLRSCSFVKFFFGQLVVLVFSFSLSIARKYSVLQQTGGDTSFFCYGVLDWFLFSRDIAFRLLSIFHCFLTGIASLNITAHNASHRKGTQIRFLRFFQNRFSEMEVVCKGSVVSCHEYPWSSRLTCRCEDYHAQWGFSGR